ncbi:MAG: cation diffusion facilitator family transporter [Chloroflexota bacterium]|nr:cation diffusion facilitator family transporter [Chloroflexota bacterium]
MSEAGARPREDQHRHNHFSALSGQMKLAVLLTGAVLVGEVAGGLLANSLALLSDAGHVFTDLLALSLSWYGVKQAERPASARMTFGYYRIGILIALINAVSIIAIALVIFYEAYRRFQQPEPVQGTLMFGVALIGLLANLVVVRWLWSHQKGNLNVRSAFLHAFGDALSSVAVVIGGIIIIFTAWFWLDPILSILIAVIIGIGGWRIVKETISIFLEASPGHLNLEELARAIREVPGVENVHDLHVWTVSPEMHALSCHVRLAEAYADQRAAVLGKLGAMLQQRFDIEHPTVQLDCMECDQDTLYCTFSPNEGAGEHHHQPSSAKKD